MAQGDPPVYDLSDPDGNTVAEIRHDLAEKLLVEVLDGNEIDFQSSDLSNIASLNTDVAQTASDPVYDVSHPSFGAVGDGSADDSSAIQSAVDQANTDGGGVVYLPPNTYLLDSKISVKSDVWVIGAGTGTVLKMSSTAVSNRERTLDAKDVSNVLIRDLKIDGNRNGATESSNSGVGVGIVRSYPAWVQNLFVENTVSDGIYTVFDSMQGTFTPVVISENTVRNAGRGGVASAGGWGVRVVGNDVQNPTNDGINFEASSGATNDMRNIISNNFVRSVTGGGMSGIRAQSPDDAIIDGMVIKGNWIKDATGRSGIRARRLTHATISGNAVIDSGDGSSTSGSIEVEGGSHVATIGNTTAGGDSRAVSYHTNADNGSIVGNVCDPAGTGSENMLLNANGLFVTGNVVPGYNDGGSRNIINGLGKNSGDPTSTGDWNGNGIEGIIVRDTTNSNTYIYNNGSWSQIASS